MTSRSSPSTSAGATPSSSMVRPPGSVTAHGEMARPETTRLDWSMRGSARPVRSASRSGRPSVEAAESGARPLTPAISSAMSAAGGVPVQRVSASTASASSVPDGSFSRSTEVDPM